MVEHEVCTIFGKNNHYSNEVSEVRGQLIKPVYAKFYFNQTTVFYNILSLGMWECFFIWKDN